MNDKVIIAYKGFDKDFKCRGFQYAVGETYTHAGDVRACESGFHACEYPLDALGYYPPASSQFAVVEQSGSIARHTGDSKIASSVIKVSASIGLPELIKAAIEYTFSRSHPEGASATGYRGAASATGDSGAASATGYGGRVMGATGCALFLLQRDVNGKILHVGAAIAGRGGIKADTWYTMKAGKFVECEA